MKTTNVYAPSDLPPGEHYAILTFGSITIPGDERSRTHPGHGYPESTEIKISCTAYPTREAWVAEIERLSTRRFGDGWKAVILKVPFISSKVTVDVI